MFTNGLNVSLPWRAGVKKKKTFEGKKTREFFSKEKVLGAMVNKEGHADKLESKRHLRERKHMNSLVKKKFWVLWSIKKVMLTVFWDNERHIIIDFFQKACSCIPVLPTSSAIFTLFTEWPIYIFYTLDLSAEFRICCCMPCRVLYFLRGDNY